MELKRIVFLFFANLSAVFSINFAVNLSVAQASLFSGQLSTPASIHSLLNETSPIAVELGFEYLHPQFPTIENVQIQSSRTSTSPATGSVENRYPDTFVQTLRVQTYLDKKNQWTVFLKTILPLNSMMEFDTGNTYQPEYVLYRSEAQRPRLLLASGININEDWRVGLGLDLGFSANAEANVYLQSGSGTVSDQRISTRVKPSLIPQGSVQFQNYVLSVRGENRAKFELNTNASARIFSGAGATNFAYASESILFYQPWEFELTGAHELNERFDLKWGLSYQLWSGYAPRAALIKNNVSNDCAGNPGCTSSFSASDGPAYRARNLWVPEAGLGYRVGGNRYLLGYRYKDSIFNDLPTGNGNYLDPPRHDFWLGASFLMKSGWLFNVNVQGSRLASQNVVKSNPSEVGGPGYTASGWLYGGGLSLGIPFRE